MLLNQFKILERVDPDAADTYQQYQEILTSGYADEYSELVSHFGEFTAEQCRDVRDILDIYEWLKLCFDRREDKSGIVENGLCFAGFDGNRPTRSIRTSLPVV